MLLWIDKALELASQPAEREGGGGGGGGGGV